MFMTPLPPADKLLRNGLVSVPGLSLFLLPVVGDILPDLQAPKGWVQYKPKGLAMSAEGEVNLVTDNDGVDDSSGETQFLHLGSSKSVFN
jgi:hypothetical protein